VRSIQIIPVRRPARGQSATSPFVIVSGFAECRCLAGLTKFPLSAFVLGSHQAGESAS
jgi:hypothetical protein